MKPSDIAFLYRMNYLSRKIEDAFLKNSIPYKILSGVSFYDRKEIKDLICYLRFIYNDADRLAFERIFNIPKRGLGKTAFEKILDFQNQADKKISLTESCKNVKFNGNQKSAVENFVEVIELCREILEINSPTEILKELINQINYFDYIKKENSEDLNLNDSEKTEKVSLMTMHASKGLEFPMVIIIGASEGIIPSSKSVMEGNLQEERRLFYVALTRAKKKVLVSYPKLVFNRGIPTPMRPSRFLSEISKDYILKV